MYSIWTYFLKIEIYYFYLQDLSTSCSSSLCFLILLLAYFCKNDTYIYARCFPTMFLVYVSLKQDVPEKDTIWKNILLKQEVPEKDTIWKTVLLNQETLEKIQSAKMFLWNMHPLETDSVCEVAVQSNITKVLRRRI